MTANHATAPKTKSAPPPAEKKDPNTYRLVDGDDGISKNMTQSEMLAVLTTKSAVSANTLKAYSNSGDALQVTDLLGELRKVSDQVSGGNLQPVEKMLVYQAITLDAIFNNLAQKAHRAEYMKNMEIYLRLAMKAQSQSRAAIEAIGLLKNPAPYIRQANIASGHQQVNNGMYATTQSHTHAENVTSSPNKLLEGQQDERLDISKAKTPGRTNKELETVGAIDRAKVGRRQTKSG
jgi:hypothetical protein